MKLRIFIRGDDAEMRASKDLGERFQKEYGIQSEILDLDDREGKEVAEVYDVTAVPSFIAATDDGMVLGSFLGKIPAEFELQEVLRS